MTVAELIKRLSALPPNAELLWDDGEEFRTVAAARESDPAGAVMLSEHEAQYEVLGVGETATLRNQVDAAEIIIKRTA